MSDPQIPSGSTDPLPTIWPPFGTRITDNARLAQILGDALSVPTLDAVWTEHAKSNATDDVNALGSVVDELDERLGRLADAREFLLQQAREVGESTLLARVLRATYYEHRDAARFKEIVESEGGVLTNFERRTEGLADLFNSERSAIRAEYSRIGQGGASQGDMSEHAQCALGWVLAVGGAIAEPVGWAAVAGGVLMIGAHC